VRLAEDLLLIARGEERNAPADLQEVALATLVARVVERAGGGGDVVQSVAGTSSSRWTRGCSCSSRPTPSSAR
jgi:hypothetical protein